MKQRKGRSIAWLCAKFIVLAPICLVAWLWLLPQYTLVLGYTTSAIISRLMHIPIEKVVVTHDGNGFLNTDTALAYMYAGHAPTMHDVGNLVCNVAPFIALVLATGGLGVWRRLGILAGGIAILFAFHVLTIVLRFSAGRTPLPTAVGFATITLPFLLWIVLAYRERLTAYISGDEAEDKPAAPPEEHNTPVQ